MEKGSVNILNLIFYILTLLGVCWVILGAMLLSFGGSVKVTIINPITKERDILTNINLEKK